MVMEPWRLTKLNSELELTLKIVEVCQDDSDNVPLASINEGTHVMSPEYKLNNLFDNKINYILIQIN